MKFAPFSVQQLKVLTWWCDNSPVKDKNGIIADGAIRSGKTVAMSLSFIFWAMERFDNMNFAMCGKTISSFRRNVLSFLLPMLETRGYDAEYKRSDNILVIKNQNSINSFYIFGGKDESSQDLIQGMTLAGVFFDEVALMPESFVLQATARCSVTGSKFWFNCNPENPHHWFYEQWIDEKQRIEKNVIYLHFTMDDNLSLSEETKARYRAMYSGVFYERFILGLWKIADGLIYDMFREERNIIESLNNNELYGKAYISCDYGTLNSTCFLLWRKYKNKWVCVKEYYYNGRKEGTQKTDTEYAEDLIDFIDGLPYECVIVDPSAASFITELMKKGIRVIKADNQVLDGIRSVGKLLHLQELLFTKDCVHTISEFGMYSWDKKAAEHGEDKPVKQDDHAMDAVRYFVSTILGRVVVSHARRV